MAQFNFHLEGLLRHRKNQERQRQRELAGIAAQLAVLQSEMGSLNGTLSATLDDLRNNRLVGKLDIPFLTAHRRYILSVQRKSALLAQKMTAIQQQVDAARANLTEAAKQRKMMEKLREKQLLEWQTRQNHHEFLEADDIGTRLAFAESSDVGEDAP
jgi:flagellar FliJ protein